MRSPTLRLGPLPPVRISGATVVTVLVLALIIYPTLTRGLAPVAAGALAVGISLFMMVGVLAHELGHAVTARAFGGRVEHIALTLWGGHTQYRTGRIRTVGSIAVSLAGPAANLLLAAGSTAASRLGPALLGDPSVAGPMNGADVWATFWYYAAILNLALAVFNLLPGLPMDGGRAVETLLGAVLRRRTSGTRITAWIGRGIAVAIVAVPLVRIVQNSGAGLGGLLTLAWAGFIAMMLWNGASQGLREAAVQTRIEELDARSLARPLPLLRGDLPVERLPRDVGALDAAVVVMPPRAPGEAPQAGRVDGEALGRVPEGEGAAVPVSAVAVPIGTLGSLDADLAGDALIEHLLDHQHPLHLVRDARGAVLGVIISAEVRARLRGR